MPRKNRRAHHEDKLLLSPIEGPTEKTTTMGFWPMSQSYVLDDKEQDKKSNDDKLP